MSKAYLALPQKTMKILDKLASEYDVSRKFILEAIINQAVEEDLITTRELISHLKQSVTKDFMYYGIAITYNAAITLRGIHRQIERFGEFKVNHLSSIYRYLKRSRYPFKQSHFYELIHQLNDLELLSIEHVPHVKRKSTASYHVTLSDKGKQALNEMFNAKFIPKIYSRKIKDDSVEVSVSV